MEAGSSNGKPVSNAVAMESKAVDLSESFLATGQLSKLKAAWQELTKGTIFSSIFTLLTTCIGAGTLSLPYAFAQGGLIPSSIIFLLILIVCMVVGFHLLSAKRYCQELFPGASVHGYEDIALLTFGAIGKILVLLTLIILLFLSLIAYMIYARDQLDLLVQFALSKTGHSPTCSPLVNCAVLVSIAFIPIFPVILLRDLTPMQITSTVSIFCIGYVGITMFIKMVMFQADNSSEAVDIVPHTFTGVLTTISYCSLAFVFHFNLLTVEKELSRPTKKRVSFIVVSSMTFAYLLYNVVIFSGYFTFYQALREDVMLNYPQDDILITTARIALFLTLLFSYPVLFHPARASFNRLAVYVYNLSRVGFTRAHCGKRSISDEHHSQINDKESASAASKPLLSEASRVSSDAEIPLLIWICETWVIFSISFLSASFIGNVGYVWNFVGSIGGTLILYIFPPAFYLRLRYLRCVRRARERGVTVRSQYDWHAVLKETVAVVIMVTGCLLLIVENYQAVYSIVNAAHPPTSLCYQLRCGTTPRTNTTTTATVSTSL